MPIDDSDDTPLGRYFSSMSTLSAQAQDFFEAMKEHPLPHLYGRQSPLLHATIRKQPELLAFIYHTYADHLTPKNRIRLAALCDQKQEKEGITKEEKRKVEEKATRKEEAKANLNEAINAYITERTEEPEYKWRLSFFGRGKISKKLFGYSKDDKLNAAKALLDALQHDTVPNNQHINALNNGKLKHVYHQFCTFKATPF
ncbi:MAG: hypothetical protein DHS20C10_08840 [marine bacterium B5-7]|nr:MAG: hypothetical protein DHS20C10_08840 [marine bacterium B5-7]